jgi:glycosyltransferase involved in cell wall biosynthesis
MSCGLPVIVTDVGDNASAVVGTGFVVPIGDVNAIAAEVQKLVADADLRRRMGARARALAVTRFDMRSSFMPIFTSYDDVLYDLNRSFVGPSFVAS